MNPYDQAHALARALKESEEYREYARLKATAYDDGTNKALLDEYKNKSLTELIRLMGDVLPMVTTNMTKDQILTYVKDLFPMLAKAEIVTNRIPADDTYYHARIKGMAVIVPDIAKNVEVLEQFLTDPAEKGVG